MPQPMHQPMQYAHRQIQYAHSVTLTVLVREGEHEQEIGTVLKRLSGCESFFSSGTGAGTGVGFGVGAGTGTVRKERLGITRTVTVGFANEKIIILKLVLSRQKHVKAFLAHLLSSLSPSDKELLRRQKHSRLDDALCFYVRLDKKHLLRNDFLLTDSGSCFHIAIRIAAFPKKRETAEQAVEILLAS